MFYNAVSETYLQELPLCEHPLTDICVAGKAVAPLPETFHTLLQTVSDVMLHLPMGSALQVSYTQACEKGHMLMNIYSFFPLFFYCFTICLVLGIRKLYFFILVWVFCFLVFDALTTLLL